MGGFRYAIGQHVECAGLDDIWVDSDMLLVSMWSVLV